MSEERKAISRQELYEEVWITPIVRLAQELGYSYPEPIAIIAAQNIGGYWYRLSHGGASEQVRLPPASEGAEREIPLGPRLMTQPTVQAPSNVGALPTADTGSLPAIDSARAKAEEAQVWKSSPSAPARSTRHRSNVSTPSPSKACRVCSAEEEDASLHELLGPDARRHRTWLLRHGWRRFLLPTGAWLFGNGSPDKLPITL